MSEQFREHARKVAECKTLPDLDGMAAVWVLQGVMSWRAATALTNTRRAELEAGR